MGSPSRYHFSVIFSRAIVDFRIRFLLPYFGLGSFVNGEYWCFAVFLLVSLEFRNDVHFLNMSTTRNRLITMRSVSLAKNLIMRTRQRVISQFGDLLDRSLARSPFWLLAPSFAWSLDRSLARSLNRYRTHGLARSLTRWLDRSTSRSIGRSLDGSLARPLDRTIAGSLNRSIEYCIV